MNFNKKLNKWIPHELNKYNKVRSLTITNSLLVHNTHESSIDDIVKCDYNKKRNQFTI